MRYCQHSIMLVDVPNLDAIIKELIFSTSIARIMSNTLKRKDHGEMCTSRNPTSRTGSGIRV